jgi:hypothetical protein
VIVDEGGHEITGTTQTKRVGERIQITLLGKGGCAPSGISWTIPGIVVKDYQDNNTTATVTPANNTTTPTIKFYWVDGAEGRAVSVSCTCANAGTKTASVTYNVRAPTLEKFDSQTDAVGFDDAASPSQIQFGMGNNAGITWDWTVTVPAGVDGWIKDVQTIVTRRRQSGKIWTVPGTKVVPPNPQLDVVNPYTQPPVFRIEFPVKVTAGKSYSDNVTMDQPSLPLLGSSTAAEDSFSYYLMYKPDTPNAIWVPIAKAEWYWKGQAVLIGATWTLAVRDAPSNPSGDETTRFPEYTSNVSNNTWQDE